MTHAVHSRYIVDVAAVGFLHLKSVDVAAVGFLCTVKSVMRQGEGNCVHFLLLL